MLSDILTRVVLKVMALFFGVCGGIRGRDESAPTEAYKPNELLAVTEAREDAEQLAALYQITLISWSDGLAKFHTDEDVNAVIRRGRQRGWPPLSLNQRYELH